MFCLLFCQGSPTCILWSHWRFNFLCFTYGNSDVFGNSPDISRACNKNDAMYISHILRETLRFIMLASQTYPPHWDSTPLLCSPPPQQVTQHNILMEHVQSSVGWIWGGWRGGGVELSLYLFWKISASPGTILLSVSFSSVTPLWIHSYHNSKSPMANSIYIKESIILLQQIPSWAMTVEDLFKATLLLWSQILRKLCYIHPFVYMCPSTNQFNF